MTTPHESQSDSTSRTAKPRVAVISYHTSPLAEAGGTDAGGMNVYVRELCHELGARGYVLDVFTRRTSAAAPEQQPFGPNARVINIDAGPPASIAKNDLPSLPAGVREEHARLRSQREGLAYDLVSQPLLDVRRRRACAWPSSWRVPHVAMFHTLGEVKNRARITEHESAAAHRGRARRSPRTADAHRRRQRRTRSTCSPRSTAPTPRRIARRALRREPRPLHADREGNRPRASWASRTASASSSSSAASSR